MTADARTFDPSSCSVSNKRGIWPPAVSPPSVPIIEWIQPTPAIKSTAEWIRRDASRVGAEDNLIPFAFDVITEMIAIAPDGYDFWQFPEETLRRQQGDCEDFSFLFTSLLLAMDLDQSVYVCLGEVGYEQRFGHSWVLVGDGDSSVIYDIADPMALPMDYYLNLSFNISKGNCYLDSPVEQVLCESYPAWWVTAARVIRGLGSSTRTGCDPDHHYTGGMNGHCRPDRERMHYGRDAFRRETYRHRSSDGRLGPAAQ
jgi:hypothetical protein